MKNKGTLQEISNSDIKYFQKLSTKQFSDIYVLISEKNTWNFIRHARIKTDLRQCVSGDLFFQIFINIFISVYSYHKKCPIKFVGNNQ